MIERTPEPLCDGFVFPETPRWHRGSFYCCSIDEGLIYRIGADGSRTLLVDIGDMVSGFCFLDRSSEAMVISSISRKKLLGFYMTTARLTETTETELDAAEGQRVFEAARSAAES